MRRELLILIVLFMPLIFTGVAKGFGDWEQSLSVVDELEMVIQQFEESIERAIIGQSAHPNFIAALLEHLRHFYQVLSTLKEKELEEEQWGYFPPVDLSTSAPEGLQYWFTFAPETYDEENHSIASVHGSAQMSLTSKNIEWQSHDGIGGGMIVFPNQRHTGAQMEIDFHDFTALTFEMWLYLDEWGTLPRLIVPKSDTLRGELRFIVNQSHDRMLPRNALRAQIGSANKATSANSMFLKEWIHLVVVHDGITMTVFINGQREETTSISTSYLEEPFPITRSVFSIGADTFSSGSGRYLIGRIDEIKIWNIARSSEEIRGDYEAVLQ